VSSTTAGLEEQPMNNRATIEQANKDDVFFIMNLPIK